MTDIRGSPRNNHKKTKLKAPEAGIILGIVLTTSIFIGIIFEQVLIIPIAGIVFAITYLIIQIANRVDKIDRIKLDVSNESTLNTTRFSILAEHDNYKPKQ